MYFYSECRNEMNWGNHKNDIEADWAFAEIKGSPLFPDLMGYVRFKNQRYGTDVTVEVTGLPTYKPGTKDKKPIGPHGFHIHEHGNCAVGNPEDSFKAAGGHWNPTNQPHGNHAGDFPVLFSNNGYAKMSFFTNKFKVSDIIDKSVIIHLNPDDYVSQPSGDSGKMIGCGVIRVVKGM